MQPSILAELPDAASGAAGLVDRLGLRCDVPVMTDSFFTEDAVPSFSVSTRTTPPGGAASNELCLLLDVNPLSII